MNNVQATKVISHPFNLDNNYCFFINYVISLILALSFFRYNLLIYPVNPEQTLAFLTHPKLPNPRLNPVRIF